ncbi:MAG: iron-sulfur cluster assembly scaffold protein [Candidatus Nanohaloarchaea archaeon]
MYREEILDHYRNPRNSGRLEDAFDAEGENPSCGDHTHVYVEVEKGKVNQVRHETDGCAISTAAMSVLSEELEGMDVDQVKELDREWMVEKLGIDVSPMRVKCAVLGLKTVQEALES